MENETDDCEILYSRQQANSLDSDKPDNVVSTDVPEGDLISNIVSEEEWLDGGREAIAHILLNYVEMSCRVFDNQSIPPKLEKGYFELKKKLQKESGTDVELLFKGSHAHNLLAFHWRYPSVTTRQMGRRAMTDIDILLVDKSHIVVETEQCTRQKYMMKSTLHPGYINLFKGTKTISSKGFRKYWKTIIDKVEIHARGGRGTSFPPRGNMSSGPAVTRVENISVRNFYDHDFVPALKCTAWPVIANGWKSRERKSGWPSGDLIRQCLDSDCHIVPVGNKLSPRYTKGNEWRLSFSGATLKLAQSLSLQQRQALILCKLLIKEVIYKLLKLEPRLKNVKLISSYEIKTAFLWLLEDKTTWGDLFSDCKDIIRKLLYFLSHRYLPDYFIPERNIIETVSFQSIEMCSEAIQSNLLESNLVDILHSCFYTFYSDFIDYDFPEVPLLKAVRNEIASFSDLGTPSCRLYILCIIYLVFDSLSAAILNTRRSDNTCQIDIDPIYVFVKRLQCILITKLNIKSFFDLDYMKQIYAKDDNASEGHEYSRDQNDESASYQSDESTSCQTDESEYHPTFSVLCSDFTDNMLGALSQDFVFHHLQMDTWAAVVYLGKICLSAGVEYSTKQEVINFESMLESNIDNPVLVRTLVATYGTKDALKEKTAQLKEEIEQDFNVYVSCAQSALGLYFHLCERYKLENVNGFCCRTEKIAVSLASTFKREIPELFDDDMLGTPELKARLLKLFKESFSDLVFTAG